ncbi:MAG: NAD-dependent epimerase/dehydratase family protein [Christensenellaceae bacterium]|nr:NAD-dependent epimerase/dehydratase family protein [Christensenellaceae bacterium]
MKVLLIGGAKFIGPAAARHLAKAGHELTLLHRTHSPELPYCQLKGDCERVGDLYRALELTQPELLLHTTAMFERQIKALEQALSGRRTRIVLLSSADVYKAFEVVNRLSDAPLQPLPLSEGSQLRDLRYPHRGRSNLDIAQDYEKILVESAALESPVMDATILRLGMVYGRNDPNHRFLERVQSMARGEPRIELPKAMADFRACLCYVEDIAHGIRLAAESRAAGEIYNLAAQETLTEAEWIRRIARLTGWKGELVLTGDAALPDGLNPAQHLVLDS